MTEPTTTPVLLTDTLCKSFAPDRAVVLMVRSPDAWGAGGARVGSAVGTAVGIAVGIAVGMAVGTAVGANGGAIVASGGVRSTTFIAPSVATKVYRPCTSTSQVSAVLSVTTWRTCTVGCSGVLTSNTTSSLSVVMYMYCPYEVALRKVVPVTPSDDRVVTAAVGSLGVTGFCTLTACMAAVVQRYRVSPTFVILNVFRGPSVL